jgi:hypothetical protein
MAATNAPSSASRERATARGGRAKIHGSAAPAAKKIAAKAPRNGYLSNRVAFEEGLEVSLRITA